MKRCWLPFAALLCLLAAPAAALEYPSLENHAWALGESLVYTINYGPVRAGESVLAVETELELEGRRVYRIRCASNSADWFFYQVHDVVISYVDAEGLFSWRYEKFQREGNFRNNEVAVFDHEKKLALRNDDGVKPEPQPITPFVKDVLAALYYVRTQPLPVGSTLRLPVNDSRKNYVMEVKVVKRTRVRVPAGDFECLLVEPRLQTDGIFLRKGRLFVWLTDDARRLPVKVKTTIPIGAITASLVTFSGAQP